MVDARGRVLLERRGLPLSGFAAGLGSDVYHLMRTASWTTITLIFVGLFLGANVIFATILYFGHANVTNANGFWDMYWFSIQTMGTIGYGVLAPADSLSNVIVTIESFVGIIITALVTGVVFARFSTPSARVIFSKVAIIALYDGKPTLMFRMANARATAIVEATARVYLLRDEKVGSESVRRIYDITLRRATSPLFTLSFTAYHVVDETSPLWGLTRDQDELRRHGVNLLVTFQGTDDRLAATVHTRYGYSPDDILFDRRFIDIFKVDPEGKRYLDYTPFHETEPLLPAAAAEVGFSGPGDRAEAG